MRELRTEDVFSFCRVIKASGMREDLAALVRKLSSDGIPKDIEAVGYDAILLIIEALAEKKAEHQLYDALAAVLEIDADEVAKMPPKDFIDAIKTIWDCNNMADFFKYVSGILGKN